MNALAEYSDSEDEAPKEKKTGSMPPTESNVASGAKAASKGRRDKIGVIS